MRREFSIMIFAETFLLGLCFHAFGQATRIESGAVSYFSSKERALYRALKIPPPPVSILPIDKVDPPRSEVARRWNAPFCLAWDDGCTRCKKDTATAKPHCKDIDASKTKYLGCNRQSIKCAVERNISNFCASNVITDDELLDGKVFRAAGSQASTLWVYDWRNGFGSWQLQIEGDALLPAARRPLVAGKANETFVEPPNLIKDFDIKCIMAQSDAVINPKP